MAARTAAANATAVGFITGTAAEAAGAACRDDSVHAFSSVPAHMPAHVASPHQGWGWGRDGDGAHVADVARGAAGRGQRGVAVVALAIRVLDDVDEVAEAVAQVVPDRESPARRRGG